MYRLPQTPRHNLRLSGVLLHDQCIADRYLRFMLQEVNTLHIWTDAPFRILRHLSAYEHFKVTLKSPLSYTAHRCKHQQIHKLDIDITWPHLQYNR